METVSVRAQGRIAGMIYLGLVVTGIFALAFAPRQLINPDDLGATLANLQGRFAFFLAMIAAGVVMAAFFLALPFALARFLSRFGRRAAWLMILFVVLSIPATLAALWFYGDLAFAIAGGGAQIEDVSAAREGYRRWIQVSTFFWGVWLAPLGWLIFKSGAIPRWLGVMLMVGSVGYLVELFGPMLFNGFSHLPFAEHVSTPASIGELGTCFWLVAFGARGEKPEG